jgi:ActR/RegA family two-component response regulator
MAEDLASVLRSVTAALSLEGARFAVIGGLAVSARAEPRFTRDVDLAIAVADDAEAERLAMAMQQRGYPVTVAIEQEATGRLATVRTTPPNAGGRYVDLLFASSGIEPELVGAADRIEVLSGVFAPVATVAHLIVLKLLARDDRRRPNDADDLRSLREVAVEADWVEAERAAALVHERGFDRGRDLLAALSELRAAPPW